MVAAKKANDRLLVRPANNAIDTSLIPHAREDLPFKGTAGRENGFGISKEVVIQVVESPSGRTSNTNHAPRIEVSDNSERDTPIL